MTRGDGRSPAAGPGCPGAGTAGPPAGRRRSREMRLPAVTRLPAAKRFDYGSSLHDAYAVGVTRQKILITGASSGLGAGMARAFAVKGRDLALCARRLDRLDELRAELTERHPGITVAVAALDVNDHEQVP